ncbi:9044_t:CDS:2 [Entrophospora sp. SA101]|nr:9044_t:CDS:2 [Entrophospora sp. SA101]
MEQIKPTLGNNSGKNSSVNSNSDKMMNNITVNENNNIIMSFQQGIGDGGSGDGIDATAFDYWELANYLVVEEELSKTTNIINNHNNNYDISPLMNSSITTTPSLIPSPISYFDSPLVGSINSTSFNTSPNLEPALSFFPDLIRPINMADEQQQPLLQLTTTTDIPSVTIPVDDDVITSTTINNSSNSTTNSKTTSLSSSPALNIPWADTTNDTEDFISDFFINNNNANNASTSTTNKEIGKDPEMIAEELAVKRAKNTDAARRSRLRKVMKMESLENQVSDLKNENSELNTKIAVMESEKKGLEHKNMEKDTRIRMLEQQLAEAHERLISRS